MGSLRRRRSHQVNVAGPKCCGSRTEASASPVFNNPLGHNARWQKVSKMGMQRELDKLWQEQKVTMIMVTHGTEEPSTWRTR
jgi:hypothetical protein